MIGISVLGEVARSQAGQLFLIAALAETVLGVIIRRSVFNGSEKSVHLCP